MQPDDAHPGSNWLDARGRGPGIHSARQWKITRVGAGPEAEENFGRVAQRPGEPVEVSSLRQPGTCGQPELLLGGA